jgi:hypothetical protein
VGLPGGAWRGKIHADFRLYSLSFVPKIVFAVRRRGWIDGRVTGRFLVSQQWRTRQDFDELAGKARALPISASSRRRCRPCKRSSQLRSPCPWPWPRRCLLRPSSRTQVQSLARTPTRARARARADLDMGSDSSDGRPCARPSRRVPRLRSPVAARLAAGPVGHPAAAAHTRVGGGLDARWEAPARSPG